jgi:predicted Rossmann fold nucleotide-binding protein DprA/Smf involved in DNA uptake
MSVTALSADSQAITLLCSTLALPRGSEVKPLSPTEWSSLATMIHRSELQRPGALLGLDADALRDGLELSLDVADRLTVLLARGGQLALELDRLAGRGIWVVTRADEAYPPLVKERLKTTAPPLLFGAGRSELLVERAIAVVGSRDADESSLSFASLLGRRCAEAGFAVVSGAARGVDSTAMVAAADVGGGAIGFVADALEKMTRRQDLRGHLVDGNLALASPYHPAARFTVGNAMRRNRLIYALAEAAVVVAASGENGGTRGGALENQKAGWTPLFVRADADSPTGNRDLLNRGGLPLHRDDLDDAEALKQLLARAAFEGDRQVRLDDVPVEQPREEGFSKVDTGVAVAPTLAGDGDESRGGGEQAPARESAVLREPAAAAAAPEDLFLLVWSRLAEFLAEPRSERECAEAFALELTQARAWLKRAVEEGLVDRIGRQRRYRLAASRPEGLFPVDDTSASKRKG